MPVPVGHITVSSSPSPSRLKQNTVLTPAGQDLLSPAAGATVLPVVDWSSVVGPKFLVPRFRARPQEQILTSAEKRVKRTYKKSSN